MITIQYVAATALSLLVFVALANFVVDLYARGVVRSAVDEAARAGATIDSSAADCERRARDVLGGLLGGGAGRQVGGVVSRGRRRDAGAGPRRAERLDPRHPDLVVHGRRHGREGARAVNRSSESGFVATELALGVGLLVIPVALLVLTLPGWSERQVTARVISREVARRAARDGVCDLGAARALGVTMAHNLGVPGDGFAVELACPDGSELPPGSDIEARVTVAMPAVQVPGIGAVGAWSWTARHREPVDRYSAAP